MVDYMMIYTISLTVLTALWGILKVVAPYTKTKRDDNALKIIDKLIKIFSVEVKDKTLEITIKK